MFSFENICHKYVKFGLVKGGMTKTFKKNLLVISILTEHKTVNMHPGNHEIN